MLKKEEIENGKNNVCVFIGNDWGRLYGILSRIQMTTDVEWGLGGGKPLDFDYMSHYGDVRWLNLEKGKLYISDKLQHREVGYDEFVETAYKVFSKTLNLKPGHFYKGCFELISGEVFEGTFMCAPVIGGDTQLLYIYDKTISTDEYNAFLTTDVVSFKYYRDITPKELLDLLN